jgi:hypothetical protein
MFKVKKCSPICETGKHENIDVICNFPVSEISWKNRICVKCKIPEKAQEDKEYIQSLKNAEKHLIEIGIISDD